MAVTYGTYTITDEMDGSQFWTTATAPTSPNYTFTISNLVGDGNADIKVGDIILYSYYRYTVTSVGTTTVLTSNRQSLRGGTGAAGLNNATVVLYKRSSSTPALPTGNVTYTFSTGTATDNLNGWTQDIPSGTDPLYSIRAVASANTATDTIATTEWQPQTPVVVMENGTNGDDGYNQATLYLYQRKSGTAPSKPSSAMTYNFSDGSLTTIPSGWYRYIPDGTNPCYVTSAIARGQSTSVSVPASAWADVVKLVENGVSPDPLTIASTKYQEGSSNTTAPTGTWSDNPVAVAEGKYLWTKVTYSDNSYSYSVAKQGISGTNGTSVTVTSTVYAYKLSTSGTTIPTGDWSATPVAPTTTQYAWTRTTTTFSDGSTAVTYTVGGKTGTNGTSISITSTSIKYAKNSSGTSHPTTGWDTTIPTVGQGEYLWTQTIVNYSDNTSTEAYSVSRNAVNGTNGTSPTVTSTTTQYAQTTSGTTTPTSGWQNSPPTAEADKYMWTKVTVTYSDSATAVSYSVSKNGTNGTNGTNGDDGLNQATIFLYKRGTSVSKPTTSVVYTFATGILSAEPNGWTRNIPATDSNHYPCWVTTAVAIDSGTSVTLVSSNWSTPTKLVEDGADGVSVTNVTSTNNTQDGGTSVVTVTLSDGTTKTFNVKNGNTGSTGSTAEWYYGTALTHTSGTATLPISSTSGVVVGSMYLNSDTSLCYKCTAISGSNATWTYAGDLTTGIINNIEIGGRNLLQGTANPQVGTATPPTWICASSGDGIGSIETINDSPVVGLNKTFRITNNTLSSKNRDWQQNIADLLNSWNGTSWDNREWVFSAWVRAIGSECQARIRCWGSAQNFIYTKTVGTSWEKIIVPIKLTGSAPTTYEHILFGIYAVGSIEYIAPKLEKGNIPTDWTPAPEDVDSAISDINTTTTQINESLGSIEAPYSELEWVESTGKQFVYLDWKPPIATWGFEIDFLNRNAFSTTAGEWNESTNVNGYGSIFGVRNAPGVNNVQLSTYSATGTLRVGAGDVGSGAGQRTDHTRQTIKLHGTTVTKPDGSTTTVTRVSETANKPYCNMTVFAFYGGLRKSGIASISEPSTTRIYSLKFYDGDTLTVDLVGAIRKSDQTTGLYDKVSQHFYPAPAMLYGNVVGDIGIIDTVAEAMAKANPQTIVVNKNRNRMWEATVPFSKLDDGQKLTVTYSYGGIVSSVETTKLVGWDDTGNNLFVYLKLTLADGSVTDWIPCYYAQTTRLTTHYGAGIPINFTYRENMLANATETAAGSAIVRGFYADANYYSDTIGVYGGTGFIAGTNGIKKYSLIMEDSNGTWQSLTTTDGTGTTKPRNTVGFIPNKILYMGGGSSYAAGKACTTCYDGYGINLQYSTNCGTTLVIGKPVYLVGTINSNDGLFYLEPTWWTQTEPVIEDGCIYIYLGNAYSTSTIYFTPENPIYIFKYNEFMKREKAVEIEAATALESANGKNTSYYQAEEPTLGTYKDGDTWFKMGLANIDGTKTGSIVSVDGDVKINDLVIDVNAIQAGSGDPSPENVRPISGWTGCNLNVTGKNLLPTFTTAPTISGLTISVNNGKITINGTTQNTVTISAPVGDFVWDGVQDVWLSGCPSGGNYNSSYSLRVDGSSASEYSNPDTGNGTRLSTYTSAQHIENKPLKFTIVLRSGTYNDLTFAPMLNFGNVALPYEEYKGHTYPISWQSEAGTVYGGTIDVVSGVLTVDRAMYLADGSVDVDSVSQNASGLYYTVVAANIGAKETNPLPISNRFKSATNGAIGNCYITYYGSLIIAFLPDQSITTKAGATQWFADNPTQFVYELATPQTYQLTPPQISLLANQVNNIWADTGDITLTGSVETTDAAVEVYQYKNNEWVLTPYGSGVFATIDAGKITTGTLSTILIKSNNNDYWNLSPIDVTDGNDVYKANTLQTNHLIAEDDIYVYGGRDSRLYIPTDMSGASMPSTPSDDAYVDLNNLGLTIQSNITGNTTGYTGTTKTIYPSNGNATYKKWTSHYILPLDTYEWEIETIPVKNTTFVSNMEEQNEIPVERTVLSGETITGLAKVYDRNGDYLYDETLTLATNDQYTEQDHNYNTIIVDPTNISIVNTSLQNYEYVQPEDGTPIAGYTYNFGHYCSQSLRLAPYRLGLSYVIQDMNAPDSSYYKNNLFNIDAENCEMSLSGDDRWNLIVNNNRLDKIAERGYLTKATHSITTTNWTDVLSVTIPKNDTGESRLIKMIGVVEFTGLNTNVSTELRASIYFNNSHHGAIRENTNAQVVDTHWQQMTVVTYYLQPANDSAINIYLMIAVSRTGGSAKDCVLQWEVVQ